MIDPGAATSVCHLIDCLGGKPQRSWSSAQVSHLTTIFTTTGSAQIFKSTRDGAKMRGDFFKSRPRRLACRNQAYQLDKWHWYCEFMGFTLRCRRICQMSCVKRLTFFLAQKGGQGRSVGPELTQHHALLPHTKKHHL